MGLSIFDKLFGGSIFHANGNLNRDASPSQVAKLKNSNINVFNQVQSSGTPTLNQEEIERQRREKLVAGLRNQWLLSNDGISPARAAGMEWGSDEKDWVNQQLASRNENWKA